ncbi:MAG: MFS transporter [Frankiaceae bacterium]
MAAKGAGERAATYREVLACREFRWLLGSQVLSLMGDQALRVALSVLVFKDTQSAWLTGLAYALTYLPWVVGGPVLAGLADRMSRRTLMVLCDVGRAVLVGLVAVPGQPLLLLLVWVLMATLLTPPFESARSAILPDMLEGDRYVVGFSLWTAIRQVTQVLGFGGGGLLVAWLGTHTVLVLDAGTFALSAVGVAAGLRSPYLPVPSGGAVPAGSLVRHTMGGAMTVLRVKALRSLLLIAWWAPAVALIPEAIAAPYALSHGGGGTGMTGLYMAAIPAGVVAGTLLLGRLVRPANRTAYIFPLATLTTLPLVAFLGHPPPAAAVLLLVAVGMAMSYQLPLQASFVLAVPGQLRGRAFAVAASGLVVAQGAGALAGGALSDWLGPAAAIGWAGLAGVTVMVPLVILGAQAVLGAPLTASAFATVEQAQAEPATEAGHASAAI